MQVTEKRHRPNWDQQRLGTYFVRGIRRDKAPVGRVYEERDEGGKKTGTMLAEIEEVTTLVLYNPRTKESQEVVIDPRHPQARDHLKIAQDVIEGRIGGLTPVRLAVERTVALDPLGKELEKTEIDRVGEMETPAMTRGQTTVSAYGKRIGEWTPELDAAVDRAASLRAAREAARFITDVSVGGDSWSAVQARARARLAEHWKSHIPEAEMGERIGLYEPQNPGELLDGRFLDQNGREIQGTFDATREPPPEANRTAEAQYFYQQAVVEAFAERMQAVDGGLLEATQGEMMAEGLIPVKKPGMDPKIEELVNFEKARAVAAHVLAGYQHSRGAAILHPRMAEELQDHSSLHADIDQFLSHAGIGHEQKGEHYLGVASVRSDAYHQDAKKGVKLAADKCIKDPGDPKAAQKARDKEDLLKHAHSFVGQHAKNLGAVPEALENFSFM